MKNIFILFLFFSYYGLFIDIIFAQKIEKIDNNAKIYAATIQEQRLKKHLFVIAADSMEGRETGKRGQKRAAKYIHNHFKNIGLQKSVRTKEGMSYLQEFQMITSSWQDVYAIDSKNKKHKWLKDIFTLSTSKELEEEKEMEAIWLPISVINSLTFDTLKVQTNQVFFVIKVKNDEDHKKMYIKLRLKGIKNIFFVCQSQKAFEETVEERNFYLQLPQKKLSAPIEKNNEKIFYISPRAADALVGKKNIIKEQNYLKGEKIKVKAKKTYKIDWTSENVLGFLQGSDKNEELIIITAHYDHIGVQNGSIYNGADDDGSGTVALLELAEVFSKASREGFKPRRSILFMAFSGEELGLLGSQFYTDLQPIFPLHQTVVNLNMDMIGRIGKKQSKNTVCIVGSDRLSSELDKIHREINKELVGLNLDYSYDAKDHPERIYYRSDHYNFAKNNIPVIFYNDGTHQDYHQPTDDADKIDYPNLQKITKLVFYTAWELANRENRIKIDKKDKSSDD